MEATEELSVQEEESAATQEEHQEIVGADVVSDVASMVDWRQAYDYEAHLDQDW